MQSFDWSVQWTNCSKEEQVWKTPERSQVSEELSQS